MELYSEVAYKITKTVTLSYSTSFGLSSRLFEKSIRKHIYAIYALVRIADEVVDTYMQKDAIKILNELEQMVYSGMKSEYSTNPIVHAFCLTANKFEIEKNLIVPFFESMKLDLKPQKYNSSLFDSYVYGSAEVIGLMCLKVFCNGDKRDYLNLKSGARKLGSAYQKVNFLRDIKADFENLGRSYFPEIKYKTLSQKQKNRLVNEISEEFEEAKKLIDKLPRGAKPAVYASYRYYMLLLSKIERSTVETIKTRRIRINNLRKMFIFFSIYLKSKLGII